MLAVPVVALSASAGGSNQTELLVPTDNDQFASELIQVDTGLSAGGFVQVTSVDERFVVGAKVVVGR